MVESSPKSISIEVHGLEKSFHDGNTKTDVLKNISLNCYHGEILMIVGPSGCGKTTLLSCMVGTLSIDAGNIVVLGHSLQGMNDDELIEFRSSNVGFIFQQFNLIPTLTLAENVSIPLIINFYTEEEAFGISVKMLEAVGLESKTEQRPNQLSGGQQQRVAIARALVHQPQIIICDEPTSSLDGKTGHAVVKLLKDMASGNQRTVVIVTHDSRIFEYADRIIEMEDGKIKHIYDNPQDYHKKSV